MNPKALASLLSDLIDSTGCEMEEGLDALRQAEGDYEKARTSILRGQQVDWSCPKCRGTSHYSLRFSQQISIETGSQSGLAGSLCLIAHNCEGCDFVELYRAGRDRSIRSEGTYHEGVAQRGPYR